LVVLIYGGHIMEIVVNGLTYIRVKGLWENTNFGLSCSSLRKCRIFAEAKYNKIVEETT